MDVVPSKAPPTPVPGRRPPSRLSAVGAQKASGHLQGVSKWTQKEIKKIARATVKPIHNNILTERMSLSQGAIYRIYISGLHTNLRPKSS